MNRISRSDGSLGEADDKGWLCHLPVNCAVLMERLSGKELRVTDPGGTICNLKGKEELVKVRSP